MRIVALTADPDKDMTTQISVKALFISKNTMSVVLTQLVARLPATAQVQVVEAHQNLLLFLNFNLIDPPVIDSVLLHTQFDEFDLIALLDQTLIPRKTQHVPLA